MLVNQTKNNILELLGRGLNHMPITRYIHLCSGLIRATYNVKKKLQFFSNIPISIVTRRRHPSYSFWVIFLYTNIFLPILQYVLNWLRWLLSYWVLGTMVRVPTHSSSFHHVSLISSFRHPTSRSLLLYSHPFLSVWLVVRRHTLDYPALSQRARHVFCISLKWERRDASYFSPAVVATIRAPFLRHVSFNSGLSAHYTPARVYTRFHLERRADDTNQPYPHLSPSAPNPGPLASRTSIDGAGRLWILQITSGDFQCLSSCADTFW